MRKLFFAIWFFTFVFGTFSGIGQKIFRVTSKQLMTEDKQYNYYGVGVGIDSATASINAEKNALMALEQAKSSPDGRSCFSDSRGGGFAIASNMVFLEPLNSI